MRRVFSPTEFRRVGFRKIDFMEDILGFFAMMLGTLMGSDCVALLHRFRLVHQKVWRSFGSFDWFQYRVSCGFVRHPEESGGWRRDRLARHGGFGGIFGRSGCCHELGIFDSLKKQTENGSWRSQKMKRRRMPNNRPVRSHSHFSFPNFSVSAFP